MSAVSTHVLADGAPCPDFHQFLGRTDEHGGAVATEDGLRPDHRRLAVMSSFLSPLQQVGCMDDDFSNFVSSQRWMRSCRCLLRCQCLYRTSHSARGSGRVPGSKNRSTPPPPAHREHGMIVYRLCFLCNAVHIFRDSCPL